MRKYLIFLLSCMLLLMTTTAYADQVTTRQLQKLELCIVFDQQPVPAEVNGVTINFEMPKQALGSFTGEISKNSFHDGSNYLGVVGTLLSITNNSPYPAMINWLDSAVLYDGVKLGIPFVDKMTYDDYANHPAELYIEVAPGQKAFIHASIPPTLTEAGWLQKPILLPKNGSLSLKYVISVKVNEKVGYAYMTTPTMYLPNATYEYLLSDPQSNY